MRVRTRRAIKEHATKIGCIRGDDSTQTKASTLLQQRQRSRERRIGEATISTTISNEGRRPFGSNDAEEAESSQKVCSFGLSGWFWVLFGDVSVGSGHSCDIRDGDNSDKVLFGSVPKLLRFGSRLAWP